MDHELIDGSYLSDPDDDGLNEARFLLDELDESFIPETPSPFRASRRADSPPPSGGPGCRLKRRRLAEECDSSHWLRSVSLSNRPENLQPTDGAPLPGSSSSSSSCTPSSSSSSILVSEDHGLLWSGCEFEAHWTVAMGGAQPGPSLPPLAGARPASPLDSGSGSAWEAIPLLAGPGSEARPADSRGRKRGRTRTPRPRPDPATPAGASLSFLTEEERHWVNEKQPAATLEENYVSDEDVAVVRCLQLEEDEAMARNLQYQFDREDAGPQQRVDHHRPTRNQPYLDPRWNPTGQPVTPSLQDHDLIGRHQRRGRGRSRARGQRSQTRPDLSEALHWNDYEALLRFEEQQGSVVNRNLMSRQQIDRFPTKTYSPAPNAASTLCHICFCDYADGDQLRMLSCFHDYHVACIDRWLKDNATCPICRANMTES